MLIARAGINEGFDATHIPSYGPESAAGRRYADVHVAEDEVLSPASPEPAHPDRLQRPEPREVRPGRWCRAGSIIYDSSVDHATAAGCRPGVKVVGVPFTEIAVGLGKAMVKNIVALGALQAATEIFPKETFLTAIRQALKDKCAADPAQRGGLRARPESGGEAVSDFEAHNGSCSRSRGHAPGAG